MLKALSELCGCGLESKPEGRESPYVQRGLFAILESLTELEKEGILSVQWRGPDPDNSKATSSYGGP